MDLIDELKDRVIFYEKKGPEGEPPAIKEILYKPYPCEGCGEILEQKRIVNIRKAVATCPHISEQCQVCKLYKNPLTGKFDCTVQEKNAILRRKDADSNK